ncbi:hypothetical protein Poli38472_000251 [Pythium oligandrum]|uniref:Uncharacterized protein n=1 Tax=Pythium oligandrum TaxID=41045 RepID=A0A8K1FGN9_PYTOL|nr:hypothetical protein Poli38472_000251 [Pythium oligandrum]|eukprot:TMW60209.1 hypothetical protein Poli38472_000251 [Pythium oligandrum]
MSGGLRVAMALSVAGMLLLPLFGLLIRFQPSFLHGLHADRTKAERNCYIAAGIYGVVFVLSAVALRVRVYSAKKRAHEEQVKKESALKPVGKNGGRRGSLDTIVMDDEEHEHL